MSVCLSRTGYSIIEFPRKILLRVVRIQPTVLIIRRDLDKYSMMQETYKRHFRDDGKAL